MLTKDQAISAVNAELRRMNVTDTLEVVDSKTIEKSFGWIFFYNSKKFVLSGLAVDKIAGNGPVFVNKYNRDIKFFGSTPPLEEIIQTYERETAMTRRGPQDLLG